MSIRQSFVCENCKHEFGCIETFQTKTKGKIWLCRVCEFENSNCNSQTILENKTKEQPKSITAEAEELVNGPRNESYGDYRLEAAKLARVWSEIISNKLNKPLDPEDVPKLMIALKLIRETNKAKRDNRVDMVGYTILLERFYGNG
jgi:hypothetical protein